MKIDEVISDYVFEALDKLVRTPFILHKFDVHQHHIDPYYVIGVRVEHIAWDQYGVNLLVSDGHLHVTCWQPYYERLYDIADPSLSLEQILKEEYQMFVKLYESYSFVAS